MYDLKALKTPLLNICVDNLTMTEALDEVLHLAKHGKCAYVVTPNVSHLVLAEKDKLFQQLYREADLVLTDGMPLIWLSGLFGTSLKEKVSGSDLLPLLAERAAQEGKSMFFLGAPQGVAQNAAQILNQKHPDLQIVGTYSPPYGFETDEQEVENILQMVLTAQPDILILCLGTPKQEKFIYQYREQLDVPVTLCLGASLDFVAGRIKRAPRWMSEHGLEWLYRILQEPRRLTKRYIFDFFSLISLLWVYRPNKSGARRHIP